MANNELKTKTCAHCRKTKPSSAFYKKKRQTHGYKDKLSYICSECEKKAIYAYRKTPKGKQTHKVWYAKYYKEHPNAFMNYHLKAKYGITREQYNEKFEQQKGCCAICDIHQSKLNRALAVDHNHKTKEIRGLLCPDCNRALGLLKENTEIIKSLLEYVYRYNIKVYEKSG